LLFVLKQRTALFISLLPIEQKALEVENESQLLYFLEGITRRVKALVP
jgi:hypothetical protein